MKFHMLGNNNLALVSVIINCYNGQKYLAEAIDSVFSQTYKDWEIIFWDNCSTDDSAKIAKSYGEKLKYYCSNTNTTLGEARNKAISAKSINEKIDAENELSAAMGSLNIQVEAYPDLKANTNFIHLQTEIGDIENKLASVRRFFNSATKKSTFFNSIDE